MSKSNSLIPLICTLCPKNPNFSDLSHLLTHISSKSHLSNRFNLQIRSQTEPEAKEQLNVFDAWYDINGLENLLAERLAIKQVKKEAKNKKERTKAKRDNKETKKHSKKKEDKKEVKDEGYTNSLLATTPVFRAPAPRMRLWPTSANASFSSPGHDLQDFAGAGAMYETPTLRRRIPNFSRRETPHNDALDPKFETPWKADMGNENVDRSLPESAKLKGVFWPGMDLFDSATPEMKRMRNQKKNGSVLESMIATSVRIEPLEVSYTPGGDFRTARNIFGPLSTETSPNKIPFLSPKKRRTRRAPLKQVSANAPVLRAPEDQMTGSPQKRTTTNGRVNAASALNPFAVGSKFVPSAEEDEEFRLTVGSLGKKRRFNVFQEHQDESPARTESPLEEYNPNKYNVNSHGLHSYPAKLTVAAASPTPFAKPVAMRFAGKENRPHDLRGPRQAFEHVYPPQLCYDPALNPLYNHGFGQPFAFAQRPFGYEMDAKPVMTGFDGDFKPNLSTENTGTTSLHDLITKSVAKGSDGGCQRAYRL
ncbi:hypothetical protein BP6252_10394 [Coleophoma cylindrospora]|uniref:Uncharacterized protein n=1 Tax=Coleophoma cylindrospora TaxID=1849047 RepID=A0A3D8QSE2_9HELO|nr:hypothetical protein BP6252_10394 [Coleophoma cylindrospora]